MGCNQSNEVNTNKIPELSKSKSKKQRNHFLLGHIAAKEFVFAKVSPSNCLIKKIDIPQGFTPYNHSSMLEVQTNIFFISGGIDFSLKDITNRCFIYDANTHKAQTVASMVQPRYTHSSVHIDKNVYVAGGRYFGKDDMGILNSCEKYSLEAKQWKNLPQMNLRRCTCYLVGWKGKVYVFGGYTGEFQRDQRIQCLNQHQGRWDILDFCLNRGIQSSFVICSEYSQPNSVTIFGGITNHGASAAISTINFQQKTVVAHKHLSESKMLHKGFVDGPNIFIFGGAQKLNLETLNLMSGQSKVTNIIFSPQFNRQFSKEMFQVLTQSHQNLLLIEQTNLSQKQSTAQEDQIVLVFGTTEQPFILQLNITASSSKMYGVPLQMSLFANAGGVMLSPMKYLLFGGIEDQSTSLSEVSSSAYLYNHADRSVQQLASKSIGRYSCGCLKIGDFVYAIGGGTIINQGELKILSSCQVYDIKANIWKPIADLPCSLMSASAFSYMNDLYVVGGLKSKSTTSNCIYRYDDQKNEWKQLSCHLPSGIQSSGLYQYNSNTFYLFGGKLDNDIETDVIWEISFTQGSKDQCSIQKKGRLSSKKSSLKVFRPRQQDFLVCLGGQKDVVSYYDSKSLSNVSMAGLEKLKNIFQQRIQHLQFRDMRNYLILDWSVFI